MTLPGNQGKVNAFQVTYVTFLHSAISLERETSNGLQVAELKTAADC